jgi:RNA polymerase sigma-70 factor, ECF subfamily
MTEALRTCGALPDEALVDRARTGKEQAAGYLEELLGRHRPSILRRCVSIIGDRDDAEDATQEVLLRVARGLDGYEGRSSFRTWLHAIVQRECWTFTAKRGRQSIPEDLRSKIELHFSAETQSSTRPISSKQLPRMLAEMPHESRDILQLRYFRELPLPQIAVLLGTTLSVTKMRLYRALSSGQNLMRAIGTRSQNARLAQTCRAHLNHTASSGPAQRHYSL